MKESPLFTKSYDLMKWLIPASLKLPRDQRFVLARRMQDAIFNFYESINAAALGPKPMPHLIAADTHLQHLRIYVRLSHDLKFFSIGQYEHVSKMIVECGRLLGGWRKSLGKL